MTHTAMVHRANASELTLHAGDISRTEAGALQTFPSVRFLLTVSHVLEVPLAALFVSKELAQLLDEPDPHRAALNAAISQRDFRAALRALGKLGDRWDLEARPG